LRHRSEVIDVWKERYLSHYVSRTVAPKVGAFLLSIRRTIRSELEFRPDSAQNQPVTNLPRGFPTLVCYN